MDRTNFGTGVAALPIFIDESGDTGSPRFGGKPYFRLAAIWLPTNGVDDLRAAIRQVRENCELAAGFEFRFADLGDCPAFRTSFLTAVMEHEFRFAVVGLNKSNADSRWNNASTPEQHWTCVTELAAILRPVFEAAEAEKGRPLEDYVIVDDNQDREFLKCIQVQFHGVQSRIYRGRSFTKKARFRASKREDLLQLADMVCGAFGAYLDQKSSIWYEMIRSRDVMIGGS